VMEAHDITIFEQGGSASVSLHLKFPADLDLGSAHEIAERVERAICARPGVGEAQTHLEPLERRLAAHEVDGRDEHHTVSEVERLVRARSEVTSLPAEEVRLLATEGGRVLFLTLGVDPSESLVDAHRLASELEEELRQSLPDLADVVIHTEPSKRPGAR
jgi:divalent metal cation (Fe/Co/Zn/Cd) transporter